jgi:hypothetical protein
MVVIIDGKHCSVSFKQSSMTITLDNDDWQTTFWGDVKGLDLGACISLFAGWCKDFIVYSIEAHQS